MPDGSSDVAGPVIINTAWATLRSGIRSLGIIDQAHLFSWHRNLVGAAPKAGHKINRQCQELLVDAATKVASPAGFLLESLLYSFTVHIAAQPCIATALLSTTDTRGALRSTVARVVATPACIQFLPGDTQPLYILSVLQDHTTHIDDLRHPSTHITLVNHPHTTLDDGLSQSSPHDPIRFNTADGYFCLHRTHRRCTKSCQRLSDHKP